MQGKWDTRLSLWVAALTIFSFSLPSMATCQEAAGSSSTEAGPDVKSLAASVLQLQSQVQTLNSQVSELRDAQQQALRDSQELRAELNRTREQLAAKRGESYSAYAPAARPSSSLPSQPSSRPSLPSSPPLASASSSGEATTQVSATPGQGPSLDERVAKLEDDQGLLNDKITEQSQTKVESGSKYRVRFSGIVLLNTEVTRGALDNLDFPQVAMPAAIPGTSGAFSGSLRQSQIGVEAFGPDIAGAHTSADIKFDFAGGFPNTPNGAAFGIVRLRTGTIRLDWDNTSIVAGQDDIFFAPLTPTTLTSLATPALSYTGNLWSWTPQIRVEHHIALPGDSHLLLQAGILDSLTGDIPQLTGGILQNDYRSPSVGEQSGQPAYAAHLGWSRKAFDRDLGIGFGGYYGRQNWGFGRNVDGWVANTDVTVPLGAYFDVTAEFYRGRAVGGLGGGIGQSILLSGLIANAGTTIHGLDSLGGWVQLKFEPMANFEVNFAVGQDDPFASELRRFPATAYYYGSELSRNLSPFVNFIYRVRSDVVFSIEYRRLQTYSLDRNPYNANQTGISLGYLF
jgi:peptidoglycan hydrolase CwlO-like protein